MSDETYLRAIRENIDDDAPRLVYADVLQERGDPWGELIVVQCAKAKLERERRRLAPEYPGLVARERELLLKHEKTLMKAVGGIHRWRGSVERGFIMSVTAEARVLRARWAAFRELPLRRLELRELRHQGPSLGELAFFAHEPSTTRSVILRNGSHHTRFDAPTLFAVARNLGDETPAWRPRETFPDASLFPALRGLSTHALELSRLPPLALDTLSYSNCLSTEPAQIRAFCRSLTFARLEHLSGSLDDDLAAAFFEAAPSAIALRSLSLYSRQAAHFPAAVSAAFANASFLAPLTSLWIDLALDRTVVRALDERLPALEQLALHREAEPGGLGELLATSLPSRLRSLTLRGEHESTSAAVVARARFERLESLSLTNFLITAKDARAFPPVLSFHSYACLYGEGAKEALLERWPYCRPS